MDHWTELEIEAVKFSTTLNELAGIALLVLGRMKSKGYHVVQICGPMSTGGLGSPKLNMERFKLAVANAERHGLVVFDQLRLQEAIGRITEYKEGGEYCTDILEVLYRKIFESGYVDRTFFLPDWQGSVGASWERQQLTELGVPIEEYPTEWLESSGAGT